MIFETHAHYDDSAFADDRDELLRVALCGNRQDHQCGASIESTKTTLKLAGKS